MWFEARRQEKKLKNIMIDHKKRAERRRQFYERIKKDPSEFMQLHGAQYKIHYEPSIALAAESPAILRPWQGDASILIDRFDARSHLDFIHDLKKPPVDVDVSKKDDREERQCNYERYRILVLNEFEKVAEDKFLKQIYVEENFGQPVNTLVKAEEEKKKKLADQKAAIAFTYEDSTSGPSFNKPKFEAPIESDESSEGDESEPEIDNKRLDVSELSNEQCKELNTIGTKYNLKMGDFVKSLWEDHDEQEQLQTMKDVEDEKAAMAGKHSRRERKLLKEIRIRERGFVANPLSILRIEESKKTDHDDTDSSSSSESSEDHVERIQYITSFGGTGSDGEGTNIVQGPAPPPVDTKKRLQELRKRRSSSDERLPFSSKDTSKPKSYSRSNRSRSRSTSRRRSRSRNDGRRRSRSYTDRHRRRRRSSSRNGRSERRRSKSRSKHRSRSRSRSRSRRRHDSRTRDHDRRRSKEKMKRNSIEKSKNHSARSPVKQIPTVAADIPSPPRSGSVGSDSNLSMLSIRSELSDSEQERRQVENTKRRLKKMKYDLKCSRRSLSSNESSGVAGSTKSKNVSIVDKLKLQTQKALKKTLAKDKEEERQRYEDLKREQNERDEELREISFLLRKKEKEKYLAEQVELKSMREKTESKSKSPEPRESKHRRSRSRSNERRSSKRSHRRRSRSRSRSRSKSKSKARLTKKLVDY